MAVVIQLFSKANIGNDEYAEVFFQLMEKYQLKIEKMGLYKPLRKAYAREEAMELWAHESPGIYDEASEEMIGKSGGMLGKGQGFWFMTHWWKHPTRECLNYVVIHFNNKMAIKKLTDLVQLFDELATEMDVLYGYVTSREAEDRQHVTGTLTERIPGIFWLNYFSPVLSAYMAKEKTFSDFPWDEIQIAKNGCFFTCLTSGPFDPLLEKLEVEARNYYGDDKFTGAALDYPLLLKE